MPTQWFKAGATLFPLGSSGQYLQTFLTVTIKGYNWHLGGKARGAIKHPLMYRTDPQNINSDDSEES